MQGDLDKRLRERNKVYEAEDGHRSIRTKTNDEIYAERLEAADTLAAVREWAENSAAQEQGLDTVLARRILAILRGDTDE